MCGREQTGGKKKGEVDVGGREAEVGERGPKGAGTGTGSGRAVRGRLEEGEEAGPGEEEESCLASLDLGAERASCRWAI